MRYESYTREQLIAARAAGHRLWALDSPDGGVDVLIAGSAESAALEARRLHNLPRIPRRWRMREIPSGEELPGQPGRPPRGTKAAQRELRVRATDAEIAAVDARAEAAGLDRSAYVRAALEAYAGGTPLSVISLAAGVSEERVSQLARKAGLSPRRRVLTDEDDTAILALEGVSERDTAGELGIARSTVGRVRRRAAEGGARQRKGRARE